MPEANGLLLIANDGNYFLEHQEFISIICHLMERKFKDSSIDGFVYFTANMPVYIPNQEREMLVCNKIVPDTIYLSKNWYKVKQLPQP